MCVLSLQYSLVPEPSTPPVFDRLQYASVFAYYKRSKTVGVEGLGTRLVYSLDFDYMNLWYLNIFSNMHERLATEMSRYSCLPGLTSGCFLARTSCIIRTSVTTNFSEGLGTRYIECLEDNGIPSS